MGSTTARHRNRKLRQAAYLGLTLTAWSPRARAEGALGAPDVSMVPSTQADAVEVGSAHPEAPAGLAEALPEGVFGSTPWGGRGLHRLVSAFGTPKNALVLSLGTAYSRVPHLFVHDDRNARSAQGVDLAYTPLRGLELSASYRGMVDHYQGLSTRNLEVQGNPSFRVKYGRTIAGPVAVGLQAGAMMPTSALGRGLAASATNAEFLGLVSWQAHRRIEVVGNVGYLMDRSRHVFGAQETDRLQQFAYQLNRVSQLPYGLGAQGRITVGRGRLDLAPFFEFSGALGLGQGATLKNDPVRITVGLKGYPTRTRVLELALGADVALGGRPQVGSPFGGQPGWECFAVLHAHLGQMMALARPQAASDAAATPAMAHIIGTPSDGMATFRLTGTVVDAESRTPVYGAQIVVGDQEDVLLATDAKTGRFHSWPISAGSGLIRVTARALGYADRVLVIPRPAANATTELTFEVQGDLSRPQAASFRGTVHDARTGRPVPEARVRIDALGVEAHSDRSGHFMLRAHSGKHLVTLEAPGYAHAERWLTLRPGETLLFNAELQRDLTTP